MDQVETAVIDLIADVLNNKTVAVDLNADSMMGSPPEWDSLAFVEIFLTVTSHFDIDASDDDAIRFMSVAEIVEFVSEQTK
jgi:acyl carrier protein